jgi:hypothetical protein
MAESIIKSIEYTKYHIPESPETLRLQVKALEAGTVPVVMFPPATPKDSIPTLPEGMGWVELSKVIGAGLYYYNPKLVSLFQVWKAARDGTHGTLLGHLQDITEVFDGEPVAVQAVEPGTGTIQDSLVDSLKPGLVLAQAAVLRKRFPGCEIRIRPLKEVLSERLRDQGITFSEHLRSSSGMNANRREY